MGHLRALRDRRDRADRGASGAEYGFVIALLLLGSTTSIEMMDSRIEDNYVDTASDIGQVDLDYFRVTTTSNPYAPSTTTTAAPTT
ncbi:MAG: hypothetical protein AAF081_19710, partial [Actinomycetota bacterium]